MIRILFRKLEFIVPTKTNENLSESSSSEDESESESTKKMKLQKKKRYNKKGRWSKAEHKKFMKAFKENKTTREMCELITTRTYDQICNHRFYFESKVRSSPTSSSSITSSSISSIITSYIYLIL